MLGDSGLTLPKTWPFREANTCVTAQPCMMLEKKPPRVFLASFGIGTTRRLQVQPHISQSSLRSAKRRSIAVRRRVDGAVQRYLKQQIRPSPGSRMEIRTPHGVQDGVDGPQDSGLRTGSQQQLPLALWRPARA